MKTNQLALISLLIIPGILFMPIIPKSFAIIPIIICLIGGLAFGSLLNRNFKK